MSPESSCPHLKGCVKWAKENNVELITEEHMKIINDKRSKEKGGK